MFTLQMKNRGSENFTGLLKSHSKLTAESTDEAQAV